MKNRPILWITILALMPPVARAQFDEVGIFTGISSYAGDLTDRAIEPLGFHFGTGVFVRRILTERLTARGQFYFGQISGSDAHTAIESGLWQRNLSFFSDVFELAALAELKLVEVKNQYHSLSILAHAGVAGFHFRPLATMDGKTYDLHAYRTEGVEYSLSQVALPFGGGLEMHLSHRFHIGLEWGWRKTFTDYLDDVSATYRQDAGHTGDNPSIGAKLSYRTPEVVANAPEAPSPGGQRGNPKRKDWYQFMGITLSANINRN